MLNGIHKSNESSGTPRLHTVGRPSVWAGFYGQRRRARVTGDLEGRGGISTFIPSVIREEARKQCENKIEWKSMWELQSQSQIQDTIDSSDSMFVVCKKNNQYSFLLSLFWELQRRMFISQLAFQQHRGVVTTAISRVCSSEECD